MSNVGSVEIVTQKRLLKLFEHNLGYENLGDWQDREGNSNVEEEYLHSWLSSQGHNASIINKVLAKLDKDKAIGGVTKLYDANRAVYDLLRYGVKVQPESGEQHQTVWLIDWKNPENNHFAVAEEVTILGNPHTKRPDIVIYVNGIALGVIELKRSTVNVSHGIRQNLDNQKKEFIQHFFPTIQLVFAGNDTEGLRYGVIKSPERFFLSWKEDGGIENPLDRAISQMCSKGRLLEIIHDYIVFDAGIKKTCRPNQYFGVKAAQTHALRKEGGIIWHTQGSGKSLTMVWLAKWLRENVESSRVLIITDRTDLDHQIEMVFKGVKEEIYRTDSGKDLIDTLNEPKELLMCSLIHKFGSSQKEDEGAFIEDIVSSLPDGFSAKGEMFVFIDECHRTQSGRMHRAMKEILPDDATIVGFTGTPLLKSDKATTVEMFGPYIHTYKYDEAVSDRVILDLRYEARKIPQELSSPEKVDLWFDARTAGLNEVARAKLKKRWSTMQKIFSAKSRLQKIVGDILLDMLLRERLSSGKGNAMLVAQSISQACRYYQLFKETELADKCAIVTSYEPYSSDIKGEESGEGETENVMKYEVYLDMLSEWFDEPRESAMTKAEEFERQAKWRFVNEPGRMKLLIVVDKLLTGFDAPSATYLYIDKSMRDHGLFQAICRVNRLDDESKEYGYIIDYKDLFKTIETAFDDYTGDVFDGFEKEDVEGLLQNRLKKAKEDVEDYLEQLRALCEPVDMPHSSTEYMQYFCDLTGEDSKVHQERRSKLYKLTRSLIRAYAEIANDMESLGYDSKKTKEIRQEVGHYEKVYEEIHLASGDNIDMKRYEPGMRHLVDSYIRAEDSETISAFDDFSLVQLLANEGIGGLEKLPGGLKAKRELVAETIRSNVRRVIIDRRSVNPAYYDRMSTVLEDIIERTRQDAENYEDYLNQLVDLARGVVSSHTGTSYPEEVKTQALAALYDNLGEDLELALRVDSAIKGHRMDNWKGHRVKRLKVRNAIKSVLGDDADLIDSILAIAGEQDEY